tara:strand:- start:312 stop:1451 length:1140 start_codon:yes stop_codon:yes gene_type:complete
MIRLPFGKPIVSNNEFNSVLNVLKSGKYVHGKKTEEFEKLFKKFTNSKYAITLSSCTAGMHLFYFACNISRGDEVIVPAQTHVATAHAVELVGAKPVFVDCELDTGNIDIKQIEKKITKRTKAIAVVHFLGVPVNMIEIRKIAKKYKLLILEDCALALGSNIRGKHSGLFGDSGVFSFYPVKHITTAEGGMLVTNNKTIAEKIKSKKAFGVDKNYNQRNFPGKYDVKELGLNYRMSEIHGCIGVEQMKKLKKFLKLRKRNFSFLYNRLKKLKNIKILKNKNKDFVSGNYCMCLILGKKYAKKRTKIIRELNDNGIGTSIYYPKPVPLMTYYKKKYNYKTNQFKNASIISEHSIALPVGPHLNLKNLNYIQNKIKKIIKD